MHQQQAGTVRNAKDGLQDERNYKVGRKAPEI
jgi:hypothetical protein